MIDTLVVLAAIGWVVWVWLAVARQLRRSAPISPPLFAFGQPVRPGRTASTWNRCFTVASALVVSPQCRARRVVAGVTGLGQVQYALFELANRMDPPRRPTERAINQALGANRARSGHGPETAAPRAPAEE